MKILIIEDDIHLAESIAEFLTFKGAVCDFAYTGESGLELIKEDSFDVAIVDLILPRMSGSEVCQKIRSLQYDLPIVMLTARDTESDQLEGFYAGVDDYIVKPCSMPLLWARLEAIQRRLNSDSDQLMVGDLSVYFKEKRAVRDGDELKFTPKCWRILEILARNSPEIVTRKDIEIAVWGYERSDESNLNAQLYALRKIIDKEYEEKLIHTVVGKGLCLMRVV